MGVNSTKSWFAVERSGKLVFFTDYVNVKKGLFSFDSVMVHVPVDNAQANFFIG